MPSKQKVPPVADPPIIVSPVESPRSTAVAAAKRRRWGRPVIGLLCLASALLVGICMAMLGVFSASDDQVDRAGSMPEGQSTAATDDTAPKDNVPPIAAVTLNDERLATDPAKQQEMPSVATPAALHSAKPDGGVAEPVRIEPPVPAKPNRSPPAATKSPPQETPLQRLPEMVSILSTLSSRKEMVLGRLSLPDEAGMDIELHGGDTAYQVTPVDDGNSQSPQDSRPRQFTARSEKRSGDKAEYAGVATFVLKQILDDAGNFVWTVNLTDYRGTIANLWVANDELRFQWTDNSSRYPESAYLCNCVLLITVPQWAQSRAVALREAVKTGPATIDFVRGTATTECKIPFMPPDVTLTVEIRGATKPLPKPSFEADRWLSTARDSTQLKFGDGAPLVVKVIASTHYTDQQPRIITAASFNLPRLADNVPGRLSQLSRVRQQTERSIQLAKDRKSQLAKLRLSDARQRAELSKTLRKLDLENRTLQTQLRIIGWLEGVTKPSRKAPGIVFRIVHSAGDYAVDLVRGGP